MMARGNVEVDMAWAQGKLTRAALRPAKDGALLVQAEENCTVEAGGQPIPVEQTSHGLRFYAQAGKEYIVCVPQ